MEMGEGFLDSGFWIGDSGLGIGFGIRDCGFRMGYSYSAFGVIVVIAFVKGETIVNVRIFCKYLGLCIGTLGHFEVHFVVSGVILRVILRSLGSFWIQNRGKWVLGGTWALPGETLGPKRRPSQKKMSKRDFLGTFSPPGIIF